MTLKETTIATSDFGNPQPQITFKFAQGLHHRVRAAEMYKVAAEIELASVHDTWVVVVDTNRCSIHLELAMASEAEARRGLRVLEKLCR